MTESLIQGEIQVTREETTEDTERRLTESCKMYDAYKKNEISRDVYVIWHINELKNFVFYLIQVSHLAVFTEVEDLVQAANIAILEHIDDYNPYTGVIAAKYMESYIMAAMNDTKPKKTTEHYEKSLMKANNKLKKAGYSGIEDPRLTLQDICHITELSPTTVNKMIEENERTICSYEAHFQNSSGEEESSFNESPENVFINTENKNFVEKVLMEECTELERYLILHTIMCTPMSDEEKAALLDGITDKAERKRLLAERQMDGYMSFKMICSLLKNDKVLRRRFESELEGVKVDQKFLQQKVNHALRRIRNATVTRDNYADKIKKFDSQWSIEAAEQISFAELKEQI